MPIFPSRLFSPKAQHQPCEFLGFNGLFLLPPTIPLVSQIPPVLPQVVGLLSFTCSPDEQGPENLSDPSATSWIAVETLIEHPLHLFGSI